MPRNDQLKSSHRSATPRLLASFWVWLVALLLLPAGLYVASRDRPPQSQPLARAGPESIPPEPPVELLEVANSGFSCEVEQVLKAKCRRCHTVPPRHAAPLPLLTWEQTQRTRHGMPIYELMGRAVRGGSMPFRILANPPVEPLTDAERTTLLDWVDAGAPRGSCPDGRLPLERGD